MDSQFIIHNLFDQPKPKDFMKDRSCTNIGFIAAFCLLLCMATVVNSQTKSKAKNRNMKEKIVTKHATGTFEVKMAPQPAEEKVGDPTVGRMSLDKTFCGDIEGTSKGQMLAVRSEVEGSAGYVAMERVTGTLGGKKGTFALQHNGVMNRGTPSLTISVVPDSGTADLIGLSGKMTIKIKDRKHFYEFVYSLPTR